MWPNSNPDWNSNDYVKSFFHIITMSTALDHNLIFIMKTAMKRLRCFGCRSYYTGAIPQATCLAIHIETGVILLKSTSGGIIFYVTYSRISKTQFH